MTLRKLTRRSMRHNRHPTVRADRGFTLVELLVVIAIISIIAGFLVPTLLSGRSEAYKVQCANNLRELAKSAMLYQQTSNKRFFPYGTGGNPAAHESLNVMVAFNTAKELSPKLFICPEWRMGDAAEIVDNAYELDESTCAYTWTATKTSPTDAGRAMSSDKYVKGEGQDNGHPKGMQVVYTDSSVNFVLKQELDGEDGLPAGLVR